MKKSEIAENLFKEGYNCAQSVVGAFCEEIGMEFSEAVKIISGFGGGMGRMREVCGAVSGMVFVLGCKFGYNLPTEVALKKELYERIQTVVKAFSETQGSIICRDLLPEKDGADTAPQPSQRTIEYYKRRSCSGCVACAAGILEKYLRCCAQ